MNGIKVIGGIALGLLGGAWIKLYGDYKYSCGRADAGEFYMPVIDALHEQNKILCNKLKEKEEA